MGRQYNVNLLEGSLCDAFILICSISNILAGTTSCELHQFTSIVTLQSTPSYYHRTHPRVGPWNERH